VITVKGKEIESGWRATSDILVAQGIPELAARVRRFVDQMVSPRTEKERVAATSLVDFQARMT
jgi:hypothetical protein